MPPRRPSGLARGRAPKNPPVSFSWDKLTSLCSRRHITPSQLGSRIAKKYGLDVQVAYFAGDGRPALETLWAMAQILECRMEDLLTPADGGQPPSKRHGRAA